MEPHNDTAFIEALTFHQVSRQTLNKLNRTFSWNESGVNL